MLDAVTHGVLIADTEQRIVAVNRAFSAITGYSRAEVLGRNCRFLQGIGTDPDTIAAMRAALQDGRVFSGEILNYRKDGAEFWHEITISPVQEAGGAVKHYVGVSTDITERRRVLRSLQDNEQRLQLALSGGSLGLWDWYTSSGKLVVNDRWMTMLGLPLEGPPPTIDTWHQHVHPDDLPILDRLIRDVLLNPTGREFETLVRARHADGRPLWILNKGAVVDRAADGSPLRIVGTHLDLTDFKLAEEELRRSEESLAITLQSIGDAVIATDTAGRVTRMNPVAELLTGWTTAAAAGQPLTSVFRIFNSSTRETLENPVQRVIAQGTVVGLANHTALLARDGREYQISDSAAPIRDAAGEIVGVVLVFTDVTETYRTQSLLENTRALLERTSAIAHVGGWELDIVSMQLRWSAEVFRILELEAQSTLSLDALLNFYRPEARAVIRQAFDDAIGRGVGFDHELPLTSASGRLRWVRTQATVTLTDGKPAMVLGAFQDITERREAELDRRATSDLLSKLAQRVPGVIYQYQLHPDGRSSFPFASEGIRQIYEVSPEQLREDASLVFSRLHPDDVAAVVAAIRVSAATLQPWQQEYRVILPVQGERWRQGSAQPDRLDDGSVLWHGFITDITERKEIEAQTHRLAHYDPLTELPNRRLLMEQISRRLAVAKRSGSVGALLFIDLDNFKQINDARGHSLGDRMLQQIAKRLGPLSQNEDTVARLGGDEFVLLAGTLGTGMATAERHALAVADRVRAALDPPFQVDGTAYFIRASIGISLFPRGQEGAEDLLREADTAMYRAKIAGRNRVVFFEAAMRNEVEERLALEQDLSVAIANRQIHVYVQPQFGRHGEEVGAELLLRWSHPRRGNIPPSEFIPIAEETGAIMALGELVLREACRTLASFDQHGCLLPLSINVSPREFRRPDFVQHVAEILAETGAPASSLIFEITEGLLIEDWVREGKRMRELVALGIRFSIDDFGIGYSSLSYLKKLPLYELKIDKSFIQDTPHDRSDTALVESILSIASHLNLRVVAEGVETAAQSQFLLERGCHILQGYFYARPQPLHDWSSARKSGYKTD